LGGVGSGGGSSEAWCSMIVAWFFGVLSLFLSVVWFLFGWWGVPFFGRASFFWFGVCVAYLLMAVVHLGRARVRRGLSYEEYLDSVLDKPLPKR
jgi:hypothetical protein